jgi:hypothetical protein
MSSPSHTPVAAVGTAPSRRSPEPRVPTDPRQAPQSGRTAGVALLVLAALAAVGVRGRDGG